MTEPIRVAADPALLVKDFLKSNLPELTGKQLTVALNLPSEWTTSSLPHVGVFDDGGPVQWPIVTSPLLRLTVWSNSRTISREIAATAQGVVMVRTIPGIANIIDPSSILEAKDSQNGGLMASFTVRSIARTR